MSGVKETEADAPKGTKAPVLSGAPPCWNWVLKRAPCEGAAACARQVRGVAAPLPHQFDAADKGKRVEHQYRAWVKEFRSG